MLAAQRVSTVVEGFEHTGNGRMVDRLLGLVAFQILLTDISDIAAVRVFGEQVVEWLIALGPYILGYRCIPFLAVGKDGIDIEDHATEGEQAVPHDVTDGEARFRDG